MPFISSVNIFSALTASETKQGIYYADSEGNPVTESNFNPATDKLYINAEYIQAESITSTMINSANLQAEKISVKDSKGSIIFHAEGTAKKTEVYIAGFEIVDGILQSTSNNSTVAIGTDAILLGNKTQLDSVIAPSGTTGKGFKVTKEGFLYSDKAEIGGRRKSYTSFANRSSINVPATYFCFVTI